MEVSGQLHSPADEPPAMNHGTHRRGAGWAPKPFWTRWRGEKNPSPSQKSNPGRPAHSLATILTELPRLQKSKVHA
jgi:hypothetical protein